MNRVMIALKAAHQLGLQQVGLYALYKFGLISGHYQRVTTKIGCSGWTGPINTSLFPSPSREEILGVLGSKGQATLLAEAEEIVSGKARLFGAQAVPIQLSVPGPLQDWTGYETGRIPLDYESFPVADIKFIWEPARFGWAFTLGRAFRVTGDEKYAETFWRYLEIFEAANPPYLGPHWMSGQEVALRLMVLAWAGQAFKDSPASSPERMQKLAASVAVHASRIPPTLVYARSQHNNHLLTEAAGLFTAGLALAEHPEASHWCDVGWRWLNRGLQSQIDSYGAYAQHSTNYQRLMLQVVLWADALAKRTDLHWPRQTSEAIRRSVHWYLSMLDHESGQVPNLGANDGAYVFPLTVTPFTDHRAVAGAAASAFLDYSFPGGPWDEMGLWLGVHGQRKKMVDLPRYLGDQLYGRTTWAYFRTVQFNSRPSHADQLHLDLWWRGLNIAMDAGTHLYNAPAPWNNPLVTAHVHNTVTVNGGDQMLRGGRFLYLDWVNAYRKPLPVEGDTQLQRIRGRYWGRNYRHSRIVSINATDEWQVIDEILPSPMPWLKKMYKARLHWLLPDWEWTLEQDDPRTRFVLQSPFGPVSLSIQHQPAKAPVDVSLVRGGELLSGTTSPDPTFGWTSPTYGVKIPALSLALTVESKNEIVFITDFTFPGPDL